MSLIWSLLQYLVFGLVQDEPAGLPWLEQRPLLVKGTFITPAHTPPHNNTPTQPHTTHTHNTCHTHTHTQTHTHRHTHTHTHTHFRSIQAHITRTHILLLPKAPLF